MAPRTNTPCSLYVGKAGDILAHLKNKFYISKPTVLKNLAAIGIKVDDHVDRNGYCSEIKSNEIRNSNDRFFTTSDKTTNKIPMQKMSVELLQNFADQYAQTLINEFISNQGNQTFEHYWHASKNILVEKATRTPGGLYLIDKLIDQDTTLLHATYGKDEHLLFHRAVKYDDNLEWLSFFLKRKVNIDFQTSKGDTALHMAVRKGDAKIVSQLLEYGASVNILNKSGDTPFHILLRNKRDAIFSDIFTQLVAYGASIPVDWLEPMFQPKEVELLTQNLKVLENLLKKAREQCPTGMMELTKALLKAYINADKLYNHGHVNEAQSFLNWIENEYECTLKDVKQKAAELLTAPSMKNSVRYIAILQLIGDDKFEYFLAPMADKPKQADETIEQFRNSL